MPTPTCMCCQSVYNSSREFAYIWCKTLSLCALLLRWQMPTYDRHFRHMNSALFPMESAIKFKFKCKCVCKSLRFGDGSGSLDSTHSPTRRSIQYEPFISESHSTRMHRLHTYSIVLIQLVENNNNNKSAKLEMFFKKKEKNDEDKCQWICWEQPYKPPKTVWRSITA